MSKVRGIRSSKTRLAAMRLAEQRRIPPATDGALTARFHQPSEAPGGTIICSCGGARYSPAAYAQHRASKGAVDAEHGAFIVGPRDPWLEQPDAERRQKIDDQADAERRAAQVEAYFRKQRARRGVGGFDDSGTIFG